MLLICCIAVSSFFILKNLKEGKEQEQTFNDLTEIIENNEEDKSGDKEKIDLLSLYKLNNDLIGWIKIENTSLNYPVVQSKIKNYYLRKDFFKIILLMEHHF